MQLYVNGVNLLPYIADEGIKVQRNDLDSDNSGRTMDGTMVRDRVCIKKRIDVECKPLFTTEANKVLTAILPEFVTVKYTDPQEGLVEKTMYSNNVPATACVLTDDGNEVWKGIQFPLIEK